jgi:hypothetical protein
MPEISTIGILHDDVKHLIIEKCVQALHNMFMIERSQQFALFEGILSALLIEASDADLLRHMLHLRSTFRPHHKGNT